MEQAAGNTKSPASVRGSDGRDGVKNSVTRLHTGYGSVACDGLGADTQEGPGLGHFGIPFGQLLRR